MRMRKRRYGYIVTVTALIFFALGIASYLLNNLFKEQINSGHLIMYSLFTGIVQVLLSLAVIWIMKKNDLFYKNELCSLGLKKGLKMGWLAYIFAVALFTLNILGQRREFLIKPNIIAIVILLFSALATGFLEEILVRGFVLNAINVSLLNEENGTKKAMLASSLIIAICHLLNLFMNHNILYVLANVVQAFMVGLYLSAIYVKSENLIAPSIIHGAIDFASFIFYAILSPQALASMVATTQPENNTSPIVSFLVQMVITLPFLMAALSMMKNVGKKVPKAVA
jgi:membrane protease YdiL (CAAX protease family)